MLWVQVSSLNRDISHFAVPLALHTFFLWTAIQISHIIGIIVHILHIVSIFFELQIDYEMFQLNPFQKSLCRIGFSWNYIKTNVSKFLMSSAF